MFSEIDEMALKKEKIKVIIERENGIVYDLTGRIRSFSLTTDAYGSPPLISMDIYGDFASMSADDYAEKVKTARSSKEWKCDFCGRPNQRKDETCKSCGSVRSFIYDI